MIAVLGGFIMGLIISVIIQSIIENDIKAK